MNYIVFYVPGRGAVSQLPDTAANRDYCWLAARELTRDYRASVRIIVAGQELAVVRPVPALCV